MSEPASHFHNESEPEPAPVTPSYHPNMTLRSFVDREIAAMRAEGRTMASSLEQIAVLPPVTAAEIAVIVRELRDADDPRELG